MPMILLLRILGACFNALPLTWALAVGRGLGWCFGSVLRIRRAEALAALRRTFPEKSERERRAVLRRMDRHLGMNVVETFRLARVSDAYLRDFIDWEGEAQAHDILGAGKGMLVLSAHIGHWDLLCSVAPRFNYPTTVITKQIKNEALNRYWMTTRERFGLKFVPAHNSYRRCLSALKKNEIVAFVLDQNMTREEGIFVDFLGKPACTTPGLAYLSAQSGAAVLPVFMLRRPGGHHLIKILPPILPPPDRKPETIREYTQRYTRIIADMVRQYPDQWIWIHRRWKTVPLAADPPAPAP